jgi:hypothetical protein
VRNKLKRLASALIILYQTSFLTEKIADGKAPRTYVFFLNLNSNAFSTSIPAIFGKTTDFLKVQTTPPPQTCMFLLALDNNECSVEAALPVFECRKFKIPLSGIFQTTTHTL